MTEEDEEFERIAAKCKETGRVKEARWRDHTKWVGLTEEEVKECFAITPDQFLPWQIYKRIEAKLKERNT